MLRWALDYTAVDLKKLTPPHFSDATFTDMNHMAIHYFILLYPIFMAGCAVYFLYLAFTYIFEFIWRKIQERTYCFINVKYDDAAFKWINTYMQEKKLIAKDRNLRCTIKKQSGNWWEEIFKVKDEKAKPEIEFKTGQGDHAFYFEDTLIWVNHSIGKTILTGWNRTPTEPEELYIVTYGTDTTVLKKFIETAMDFCLDKDKDKISIYELHRWWNGWTKVQMKKPRSIESVILDKDNSQMLCDDIRKFQNSESWYF